MLCLQINSLAEKKASEAFVKKNWITSYFLVPYLVSSISFIIIIIIIKL